MPKEPCLFNCWILTTLQTKIMTEIVVIAVGDLDGAQMIVKTFLDFTSHHIHLTFPVNCWNLQ